MVEIFGYRGDAASGYALFFFLPRQCKDTFCIAIDGSINQTLIRLIKADSLIDLSFLLGWGDGKV